MTVDVRATNKAQFETAKGRWAGALALKAGMFVLGLWSSLGDGWTYTPQVLLALALASEGLQLASDHAKGQAELVLRMLDRCRSFGYQISETDLRDLALASPKRERAAIQNKPKDLYFSTTEDAGPRAAMSNLQESAWYTRHQASRMWWWYLIAIVMCVGIAIAALLVVTRATLVPATRVQVAKIVTAWLLLIVSLSLVKSAIGYWKMVRRCEKTENACTHLLAGNVSEVDALRQWYEYQIARAAAPLIPGWLWQVMKEKLDRAWAARENGN